MRVKKIFIAIFVLSIGSFFAGGVYTFLLSNEKVRDTYATFEKLTDVYDLIRKHYVKPPDDSKLVDGAIRGMMEELDPHSVYLTKEDFSEMQSETKGEFGGIGIEISKRDGLLTVVTPIEETPAARAGILAGDVIVQIEGQSTAKMSVMEAVRLMRGRAGTKVQLGIRRQGEENMLPFTIARATIQVRSVTSEVKDGFGVIKVRQFAERSSSEVKSALNKIRKSTGTEVQGLVLDLRNNPGGLLQQAIEISDIFLKDGLIVYTQGRDEEKASKSYASARGTEPNYPLVVLVNGGSASASEIVAGALQDQKRAHLLGTTSFGKGSVQNVIPLGDGSGVKLTVALYYTPLGRQIQGAGIVPDEVVRGPNDPIELTRERDLPGHLEGVEERSAKERDEAEKKRLQEEAKKTKEVVKVPAAAEAPVLDPQLDRALAYLKAQAKKSDSNKSSEASKVELKK